MATNGTNGGDGVMRLVRQTAEGLVELLGRHLTLARLELAGDLVAVARRARLFAVLAVVAVVGYALAMAGLAVYLGGGQRVGVALLVVGLVHVGAGAGAALLAAARTPRAPLLTATAGEMKRSLATLGGAGIAAGLEKTRAV